MYYSQLSQIVLFVLQLVLQHLVLIVQKLTQLRFVQLFVAENIT